MPVASPAETPATDRVRDDGRTTPPVIAPSTSLADEARSEAIDFVPAATDLFWRAQRGAADDAICITTRSSRAGATDAAGVPLRTQAADPDPAAGPALRALSLGTALSGPSGRPQPDGGRDHGDGAFHYKPVSAALGFARGTDSAPLIVLWLLEQYASQTWNVLRHYDRDNTVRDGNFVGDVVDPTPDHVRKSSRLTAGTSERRSAEHSARMRRSGRCRPCHRGRRSFLMVFASPAGFVRSGLQHPFIVDRAVKVPVTKRTGARV